jgi:elongation factor 1-gamma
VRQFNPRSTAILAVAKADNLSLELVTVPSAQEATDDYRKLNPLAKIPTFVGSDGYVLSECIAIALYSKPSHSPTLCGIRRNNTMPHVC